MSPSPRPPGPTWATETRRPWKVIYSEISRGLLPIVRGRFERFGDLVYATNLTGTPLYSLRHPDHIHEVLVTRATDFTKRSKDLEVYLGQGLFTSNGEFWRKQRRLIQPAFHKENMSRYAEVMIEHTRQKVATWVPGEIRDINREMMELTLTVVARALLNYDTQRDHLTVAKAMGVIQETAGFPSILPRWVPTPLHKKQQAAIDALDGIILPMIDACTPENRGTDLLSLLKFEPGEAGPMSRQQLRDELVTMFMAGHETTALALTWTLYLLSQNREEERRMQAEVDRVLEGRPATFADLERLEYVRLVVQESLRMFPPLYLTPRVAATDTEVGGFPIKKGSELLIWTYFLQRDERWFPDPARFWPERFLPETQGVLHPHAFIPFGAGPRACIGRHFAMAELVLMLASIAQRCELRLAPGQDVRMNARVTLAPQFPIQMEILERRS
ncbi:MAG: cytochrome P450 [Deltaproteobacteria bacterium]|jgi:cytochrome P450|nr:cytochrome P450 [Deltaproteobacteria bacterium]